MGKIQPHPQKSIFLERPLPTCIKMERLLTARDTTTDDDYYELLGCDETSSVSHVEIASRYPCFIDLGRVCRAVPMEAY